jgi:phosphoribosylglycinamide formyltransferase 2
MSSSGHGQSKVDSADELEAAWECACEGSRGDIIEVIVEEFIPFDYEITLLTVTQDNGQTLTCAPIGHVQKGGDYQESFQPRAMKPEHLATAQEMAKKVTAALTGSGIWGVEFFVSEHRGVIFSELSPRPHDTGMVTLISQDLSEFALHARAILGLPIPNIAFHGPSASKAVVARGNSKAVAFGNLDKVLALPDTSMRIFGKGEVNGHRRVGVLLARRDSVEAAVNTVMDMANDLEVIL